MSELNTRKVAANEEDLNRDPLTGTPGSHPLGTGTGAVSGGIAGVIAGTAVAGPVGAVIGAAVGAVAGGLAGKSAAESINPTAEEIFWRETFVREPYYMQGKAYEYYGPGFRVGWEGRGHHEGRTFEQAEAELQAEYERTRAAADPVWQDARPPALAAWNRVDRSRKAAQ